jgi:HEAT repeat protein
VGPIAEDLRRWLARERGEADLEVIALPMVREMAGDAAGGFREGFKLDVGLVDVNMFVLVAASESAARDIHPAWTRTLERLQPSMVEAGVAGDVRLSRKPGDWLLHYDSPWGFKRQSVVREGNLIVDVSCSKDSECEEGAERLARRALRFLRDAAWRAAWLKGEEALLKSDDPGLRLAAVSRLKRYVPDPDWEVRWLGWFYETRNETSDETERAAALTSAIEDPHPAVVARGLRAFKGPVPLPLLRERLRHDEAAVRRAAWALMESNIGGDDLPAEEALALMREAFDDTDVAVREEAAECFSNGFQDEPGLVETFRMALTDEHSRVRQAALIQLSNNAYRLPELIPEVVDLLGERPDLAAEVLGNLGEDAEPTLPHLREAAKGPKGRAEIAMAIWRISFDPEPLLAVIRESATRGDPDGVSLVGDLGSAARPVVPEVAMALGHDNKWVRVTAAEALGRIGGPDAKAALSRRLGTEKDPKVIEAIKKALAEVKDGS